MADLRYRTFRMKVYARFCPADLGPEVRDRFGRLVDQLDEDGMEAFFGSLPADPRRSKALEILKEARALGDRLNVMDRTLPALPHAEISRTYDRLRELGGMVEELDSSRV
jgi:hypothetical protein